MTLKIDFPDEFLQELHLPKQEAQARVKRELALALYAKGLLTFGKARQLAEMNRWDFRQLLGEESVLRRYDIDEFEQDLKTLEALD